MEKNEWKIIGEMKFPCSHAAAEAVGDEIYLIGGYMINKLEGREHSFQKVLSKHPVINV